MLFSQLFCRTLSNCWLNHLGWFEVIARTLGNFLSHTMELACFKLMWVIIITDYIQAVIVLKKSIWKEHKQHSFCFFLPCDILILLKHSALFSYTIISETFSIESGCIFTKSNSAIFLVQKAWKVLWKISNIQWEI